jgi:hypothetical protein
MPAVLHHKVSWSRRLVFRANLPKEIAMIHSFDLRIGALCAVCAQLLLVPPAFAGSITEIDGLYSTFTPGLPDMFTLSGGMLDAPFSGPTNDQMIDLSKPSSIQINGMDSAQPGKSVFDLGGTMYDGGIQTRTFDINNPGIVVNPTELMVPISYRPGEDPTFQQQDISAVMDGILIFDLTGAHIGDDGHIIYDSADLSATFRIVPAASFVPEPTSLALVIPGVISLLGMRYLGRRRSQGA